MPDTTSGFRAYSRKAAVSLVVVSSFTYTLETIIQAGRRRIPLMSVNIKTNKKNRNSRLFRSSSQYVLRGIVDILLTSTQVKPLFTFSLLGGLSIFAGMLLGVRFLIILYLTGGEFGGESGHIQSLILTSVFLIFGAMCIISGFLADQIGANRILLEKNS